MTEEQHQNQVSSIKLIRIFLRFCGEREKNKKIHELSFLHYFNSFNTHQSYENSLNRHTIEKQMDPISRKWSENQQIFTKVIY